VIIRNLNIEGIAALPAEANAPLIVDANAPLTFSITFQLF